MSNFTISLKLKADGIEKLLNALNLKLNEIVEVGSEPIEMTADISDIENKAETVKEELEEITEPKEVKIEFDPANLLKNIGQVGLGFNAIISVVNKLNNSLGSLITASNVQEKATNDLISALRTQGQATEENIKAYHDFANAIQAVTLSGDEQNLKLIAMSVTMGIHEEKRQEAVKGAIGLAKAFETAGLSQETAMKGLALAYQGEYSMLQRYIPALRNASDEMEKMTILQEAMANGFTMAQQEVHTSRGALIQYQNEVGDLKEHLGDLIKEIQVLVSEAILPVVRILNANPGLIKNLAISVGSLATAIGLVKGIMIAKIPVMTAYGTIKAALITKTNMLTASKVALTAAMKANPFGLVAVALAMLINGIVLLTSRLSRLRREKAMTDEVMQIEFPEFNIPDFNDSDSITSAEDRYRRELDLLNLKRQNNYEVTEELKEMYEQYAAFLLDKYGEDSIEYQQLLRDKLRFEADRANEQIRIERERANELARLEKERLDTARKNEQALWDFRQAKLKQEDPERARLQQQLRDTRKFYEDRRAMLIASGLSDSEITEQMNNTLINLEVKFWDDRIEAQTQARKKAQEEERKAREQALKAELDHQRAIAQATFEFEQEKLMLTDPFQARLNSQIRAMEQFFDRRKELLIEAGYSEAQILEHQQEAIKRLEQDAMLQRLRTSANGLGQMAENFKAFGKTGFEISKRLQQAQVLLETPAAAFAAYRAVVGIPVIGTALAPIAFAAAIAMGAKQLKAIEKAKPPTFEKGGLLRGATHRDGGIIIEAEGDEYITNKKRVNELGVGLFDFINFAPLEQVKKAFSNLALPPIMHKQVPSPVMALGGAVSAIRNQESGDRMQEVGYDGLLNEILSSINDLKEVVENKELTVNNYITANEVIRQASKALISEASAKGSIIRSSF